VEGYTELLRMNPGRLADPAQGTVYLNAIMGASDDAKNPVIRMREFYYSTSKLNIDKHGSISQVLAKALAEGEADDEPESADGHDDGAEQDDTDTESLSPREWDGLKLLSQGQKNKDIAEMLSVSENTVKTHIKAILSKLR
jgi:DNA-binding NarL/FixJ family response regulator